MTEWQVVIPKPGLVEIEPIDPKPPGIGQVQVRTVCTLISPGTDRAFMCGIGIPEEKYPFYPGYSHIGRIERSGLHVLGYPEGTLVASGAGHRSVVNLPVEEVFPLPTGMEPGKASHFMLLTVAIHGVRELRLSLGEPVLILGQGVLGLLATAVARLGGGAPVVAADVDPDATAIGRLMGADYIVDPSVDGWEDRVREVTDGRGPSVVVEASGSAHAFRGALRVTAAGGRLGLLGCHRDVMDGIEIYRDIQCKGLIVHGIHNVNRPISDDWAGRPSLARDIRLALRLLWLDRVSVDRVPRAPTPAIEARREYLSLLGARAGGPMSRLLTWGE